MSYLRYDAEINSQVFFLRDVSHNAFSKALFALLPLLLLFSNRIEAAVES